METPAPIASKTVDPVLVRVYVSSTWLDLQSERKAVESALQKFRETKFVGMEYFGSHDEHTRSTSLNELEGVNLYIGIFAARYGSGITEDEYRLAVKSQIPCRIYFKKDSAVQDMRETDPDRIRKLEDLKAGLRKAHTVYEFDTAEGLALQLAADFHRWLFDDYIAPRLNGALRGAIDPAEAQALLSSIKDVGALQQELLSRLDNFLIGYAKLHTYPQLDDFILDFEQDMESATRGFTGREFVFEEMEAFAQNNSRGYLRLVADAGLGKTALAAAVSRRLRTPSFFASSTKGLTQPYQCLNHLSADLIIRFHLVRDHLPERSGENSVFLSSVLAEAVQRHSGPLWIVVDAVDEGGSPPPGQNPFLLPSQLPDGVFFFVTHRDDFPWQVEPNTVDHVCRLKAFDPAQQKDIRDYLQDEARRPEIAKVMATAQPPIPIEQFVTVLSKASEGNFKYLDYVIADIAAERLPPGSLVPEILPKGLNGYYDAFWKSMEAVQGKEGWSEWNSLYRPVIAFLAAARQPVTSEWLADLTGRVAEEITERALIPWNRFLRQDQSGPSTAWSIVHRSFADFLARNKKVDLRGAHGRVATFYLSRWGGLDTGLSVLANPTAGDFHILYGVRNLIAHLHEAGRTSELHRLLRLERSHGLEKNGNLWREAHETCTGGLGYLRDLDLAHKVAAADSEAALARQNPLEALGLETRYTLLISSIGSLAGNLPAELTAALVRAGVWTPERAYHYALLIPSEQHRAETLALVSGSLPEDLKKNALQHAHAAARAVQDTGSRVTALLAVAQCAGAPDRTSIIEEALAEVPSGRDDISIAFDLHAVAVYLDDSRLDRFLQVATSMTDQTARLFAFKELAPVLAQRRFQEALNMAGRPCVPQLKKYLDLRILFYRTQHEHELQQINADTAQLQTKMWSAVQVAALEQPTPVIALVVSGMNDVLNSQGYTQAAWWNRIPAAAWSLMITIAICCNLLVGYGARSPKDKSRLFFVLPLVVSIAFLLISDIDSPRGGFIHVIPQNLVSLLQSLPKQ